MKVTLELIDELRSRVNVTYEEAKSTLEKNDGDLIKSIIELEKKKGAKKQDSKGESFTHFADKLLQLKFMVRNRGGNTLINVPLVLVLATFIMAFWVVIAGLVLALCTSCKMKIYRDKNSINVNVIKQNVQETVEKLKVKTSDIMNDEPAYGDSDGKNDDINEIIIE